MKLIENICYGDEFISDQRLDLYLPDCESFPVFVFFHGGGFESGSKNAIRVAAEYLTAKGIAVVSPDYRLYPNAAYPDFLRDAAKAVAWTKSHIQEYGNCNSIYIGGSSAGGYISMMLCFDKRWLAPYKISPKEIAGYIHSAGQPTCHFNVLREKGIDPRRVIIDDSAPLFHIGELDEYAPMIFLISDKDIASRYEQTMLVLSTLKHFGYASEKIRLKVMHGTHSSHIKACDENGMSVFGRIVEDFINEFTNEP